MLQNVQLVVLAPRSFVSRLLGRGWMSCCRCRLNLNWIWSCHLHHLGCRRPFRLSPVLCYGLLSSGFLLWLGAVPLLALLGFLELHPDLHPVCPHLCVNVFQHRPPLLEEHRVEGHLDLLREKDLVPVLERPGGWVLVRWCLVEWGVPQWWRRRR